MPQGVGLRQGCSVSPLVSRWVLEDALAGLNPLWRSHGCGTQVDGWTLSYLCWADDSRLLAKSPAELEFMVCTLTEVATRKAGLVSRLQRCRWTQVRRRKQPDMELEDAHTSLAAMTRETSTGTLRVLGSPVQTDGERDLEYTEIFRGTWGAFHCKQSLWQVPGHVHEHIHLFHLGVLCSRGPAEHAIGHRRSAHRQVVPVGGRDLATVRSQPPGFGQSACMEDAISTQRWKWAGHAARSIAREPTQCLASVLLWQEARWWNTLKVLNHSDTDLGRLRLGQGRRHLGKRRWDVLLQVQAEASSNAEVFWMDIAQDPKMWIEMEVEVVARVTRKTVEHRRRARRPE